MNSAIPKVWDNQPSSLREPRIRGGSGDDHLMTIQQADEILQLMRPRQAIGILTRAIKLAPTAPALRYNLGLVQQVAGLAAAAAASFRTAAMLAPHSLKVMGGLSAAMEEIGDWREADHMRSAAGLALPVVHRVPNAPARTIALTTSSSTAA